MLSSRFFRTSRGAAPLMVTAVTAWWCSSSSEQPNTAVRCDNAVEDDEKMNEKRNYLRKRATLQAATVVRRRFTRDELAKLRVNEDEIMKRWERDEDGWRELPARAWPAYQPDQVAMQGIRQRAQTQGCFSNESAVAAAAADDPKCQELLFQIATTLVFYNIDPQTGFQQYKELAKKGHVDSMVACGVILVEGLGIPAREHEGIEWLQKAAKLGSSQACYELGTVYYTGIAGVVEEDSMEAFSYFEQAAQSNHVAAMYMVADCLVEGEGTTKNVARAVPLFYKAAEQGHRFARQRIRELLASEDYKP